MIDPLNNDAHDAAMRLAATSEYCNGPQWEKYVKMVDDTFAREVGMSRSEVPDFDISDFFDKDLDDEELQNAADEVVDLWKYDHNL